MRPFKNLIKYSHKLINKAVAIIQKYNLARKIKLFSIVSFILGTVFGIIITDGYTQEPVINIAPISSDKIFTYSIEKNIPLLYRVGFFNFFGISVIKTESAILSQIKSKQSDDKLTCYTQGFYKIVSPTSTPQFTQTLAPGDMNVIKNVNLSDKYAEDVFIRVTYSYDYWRPFVNKHYFNSTVYQVLLNNDGAYIIPLNNQDSRNNQLSQSGIEWSNIITNSERECDNFYIKNSLGTQYFF